MRRTRFPRVSCVWFDSPNATAAFAMKTSGSPAQVRCTPGAADSPPERGCVMKIARMAIMTALLAMPILAHGQASTAKNNKAAQEVIEFRNRYIEAEENRDMTFLDKILADDFFALNPQGKLLDKAGQLENLKRPDRTLKVLNPRETHVQFYANGNVAI